MDPLDYKKVSLKEAKTELDRRESDGRPKKSWHDIRKPVEAEDQRLHELTIRWMASLPVDIQPRQMARLYPRVANKLAKAWGHETDREREINELMIDSRGDRKGFPLQVASEIMALKMHISGGARGNSLDWSKSMHSRAR